MSFYRIPKENYLRKSKLEATDIPDTPEAQDRSLSEKTRSRPSILPAALTFVIMMIAWVILSGKFDAFHLTLGVISCALIAYFSSDLLFESGTGQFGTWTRFICYLPWLMYQILLCNLHLLKLAFHPRMMDLIDPQIVRFRSRLKGDLARVTFANSITLTPGTITIYVSVNGDFSVHAIDKQSAEGLPGDMEERVARVFGEK